MSAIGRFRVLLRLALRNLLRQARRSILTSLAMVVGVGLLVFSRAFADGGHEDWIEAGVRMGSGHVTIQTTEFGVRHALSGRLPPSEVRLAEAAVAELPAGDVVQAATRLEVRGLASSPGGALPVSVTGVRPDEERSFADIDDRIVKGAYLPEDDSIAAYIGVDLADRLDLDVGSRLVLTAQDAGGEIVGQLVRVRGIFRTGLPEIDVGVVHMRLSTARAWLGTGDAATSVAVLLRSSDVVDRTVRALSRSLADAPTARAIPWQQAMPELDAAVRMDDFGDYIFHAITLVIVALAVVNTILMSVLTRTREFGIVRALGMTRRETGEQVMIEGVLLAAVSGVIGIAVGLAVTWGFFRHGLDFSSLMENGMEAAGVVIEPVVVPRFRIPTVLGSMGFVFVIGVLAAIYPAYRATRIEVAEAMKFEE